MLMRKDNSMESKEEELYTKIAKVVSFVCNNPAVFVSEMDIHVLMMKALMEIDRFNPFADRRKGLRPTKCTIGKKSMKAEPSKKMYQTMLVHKEYGNNKLKRESSDIVIFDEKDIKSIDEPINLMIKGKYLEPKYVFEFGTEKSAGTKKDYEQHLKGDLEKLSMIQNTGFLIHIQRIYVKSGNKSGRYDYNRSKYKGYEESTVDIWNHYKVKNRAKKIKVLIFFVDIGGEKRYLENKVRMFNPYPTTDAEYWEKVSLTEIENQIKIILKP
jgi:hypothetical protein